MIAAEVVLLILGFISVSVSFFVGNRQKSAFAMERAEAESGARDIWTEKEEDMVREQIHSILEEEKETVMAETTQSLNRKSNEKIMEFDEFSSQVLEKINHNHEEVVFMYSMLDEKEKELKDAMVKKPVQSKPKKTVPSTPGAGQEKKEKTVKKEITRPVPDSEPVTGKEMKDEKESTNGKIVSMYKQGKSVLEISKELNIGQGEVKLMIALYGGNR